MMESATVQKQCIIHHETVSAEDCDHLVSPQTYDSYLTLLEAAKVRNHSTILDAAKLVKEGEVPKIFYHRKCRSIFTMKRDLETIKRQREESVSDVRLSAEASSVSKRPCRSSTLESRVYKPICIFCDKEKFVKGSKSREKLTQAVQLRADKTLRECAIQKRDEKIIGITSRDIVAAEAHYHLSCYKRYTKVKSKEHQGKGSEKSDETVEDESYHLIEKEAFADLFQYIRTEIIPNKEVVSMISLTARLESFMHSNSKCLKESTRKHLRRKLENELGDSVEVCLDEKGKLLLIPGSLSLRAVVLENRALLKELTAWKTKLSTETTIVDHASAQIRSVIKQNMLPTPWPYHPSDADISYYQIPYLLERFLEGLLTGDPGGKCFSDRIVTLIQSLSQDMIYAVTGGKHKPPKHVLLTYAVKTLTGNTELIRTLNRFGHGISYSQVEENETALCLQKIATDLNQRVALPAFIKPHVFSTLAWDNIDRLEETLTGKGTSHRVNGIVVQAKVYGPDLPRSELPLVAKKKQRSISMEPQQLDSYVPGTRVGPQPLPTSESHFSDNKEEAQIAHQKNLVWVLTRLSDQDFQATPSWTGFNIKTRNEMQISDDVVGYLPTIDAPATEVNTVFEILNQSDLVREELQLQMIVVVMDQALYAKAAEIAWKHKERFSRIILRMGMFHTICNALSILGKRFRDAGLKDICIEAGLVAEGSINGVLDGKHYNRAVRVHKCIYEALMRLAWAEFIVWVDQNQNEQSASITSFLCKVSDLVCSVNQKSFEELLQDPLLVQVMTLWSTFLEVLRHSNGELSAYWMSYIDMVEDVVLGLLRASREGNWGLHLNAIRVMIPWCFAYDKVNYARYLSAYFAQMTNLPESSTSVYEAFKAGQFSVQISSNNPFGRLPVDQTTEVTVNKDTQTPGGTTGFSLKAGAVRRYYMTAEHRSAFLGCLRGIVQGKKSGLGHADLQKTRIQKDEEAVSAVVDLIQGWTNPFSSNQDLVSISTAKAAPSDIASDLVHAYEIGNVCYTAFKTERLDNDPPEKNFYAPIKANKLKSFSNLCKKKEVKLSGRMIVLRADRSLFGRIIVMAQGRNLQMETILSHPLGPLPWALATPDGLLRKTNKAALATALQKNVPVVEQLPENCASMIDGMNLVKKVKGDQATFSDVASTVLSMALSEGRQSSRIDVVFDTYKDNSIKNSERTVRGGETGHELLSITATQIVRQWKTFLSRVANKNSLIAFIVSEWRKARFREKLNGKVLYATVGEKCYKITSEGSEEVAALCCSQEEADGRLLLHSAHAASEGYQAVVVCSEDTDVFILSLAFQDRIDAQLFQKCGTRTRKRIVDIQRVADTVGVNVCRGLIGMHTYTGCDTVSAFAGKGKAKALKLLMSNKDHQEMFIKLGQEWNLSQELLEKLEAFTCLLYAPKASSSQVNNLRYHLFCVKRGEIESHQLPPCKDCLINHAYRANYQAGIWRRCLEANPQVPSPVGNGWKMDVEDNSEHLVIHWMDGQPAPEAILDLLACNCARKCELPKCSCMANGLKCTDMCRLQDCENQASIYQEDEEVESEDETEIEYDY